MKYLLTALLLFITSPALAEEFEYEPEGCEFSVTFPSEPYTSRRCEDNTQDRCYDLVSFTHVIDMAATVSFRVICNPVADSVYEQYTPDVMKATLSAMAKRASLDTFDASFRETPDYKQAAIVGEGIAGQTASIYISQLWIGRESALSVEAEMIGDQHPEADELYTSILRTIGFDRETDDDEDDDEAKEEEENEAPEN